MTRRYPPFRVVLIFSVLILGLAYVSSSIPTAHATGTLYVSPADQGPFAQKTIISYNVKVSNMDPFDTWEIRVKTDPSILDPKSIDISGNVITANFSGSMSELTRCIDGVGSYCTTADTAGIVSSVAFQSAYPKPVTGPISGLLFTITYNVTTSDISKYSLLNIDPSFDMLIKGGTVIDHGDVGAIYGKPPLFPVADFTWSPTAPNTYDTVNFTAVSVSDPNSASIIKYTWVFLTNHGLSSNFTDTTVPTVIHVYPLNDAGNVSVTLTVKDSLGISSRPVSHTVTVKPKPLVFPIVSLSASSTDDILPGTIIIITVSVNNDGNQAIGNFNITLDLPPPLDNITFPVGSLPRGQTKTFQYRLDTSSYTPDVYEVLASIPPLPGQMPTELGYNNAALELRVIYSNPGGLRASLIPLSIPGFLGVLVAGAAGLGVLKFIVDQARRRRRLQAEELA